MIRGPDYAKRHRVDAYGACVKGQILTRLTVVTFRVV